MKKLALIAACCLPLYSFAMNEACTESLHKTTPSSEQVTQFAKTVVLSAFSYDYHRIDTHFAGLKNCFTHSGWKSFNNALTQSGNIASAKKDKLVVKASETKPGKILAHTEHGWQVTVPVQVHYENKTHQLEQDLTVNVVVDIEKDKLGIAQLIAEAKRSDKKPRLIKSKQDAKEKGEKSAKRPAVATPKKEEAAKLPANAVPTATAKQAEQPETAAQ